MKGMELLESHLGKFLIGTPHELGPRKFGAHVSSDVVSIKTPEVMKLYNLVQINSQQSTQMVSGEICWYISPVAALYLCG